MIFSPLLTRLVIITIGAIAAYVVVASEREDKLKNLVIVLVISLLLVVFGADFFAFLLDSLKP